jgi:choline dehydrogenase-like flavoprotein
MTIDDARNVPTGTTLDADVCVMGAGAAGIAFARELSGSALSVLLLESGGDEPDDDTASLYAGASTGDGYDIELTRLRYFGGTTNHWTGFCRPLDPLDLEARPWIANSGWPFGRETLDPLYERARPVIGLGTESFDARELGIEPLVENETVTTAIYRFAPSPVRFAQQYRGDLEAATNVRTMLHANVVGLDTTGDRGHIETARVVTFSGNAFTVRARVFVLAMGGIENARMLLAADLGNEHDVVGRYFMDHLEIGLGSIVLAGVIPEGYQHNKDFARATVCFTPDALRKHELPSMSFALEGHPYGIPGSGDKTIALADAAAVLQAIEGSASEPFSFFLRGEPEPNPDSRVTLADDVDALGMRRVEVHWKLADGDRPRYRRALDLVLAQLGANGRALVRIEPTDFGAEYTRFFYGGHHIGTTRMHTDPQRGVVNSDCRLHAVDNLYVAGSSVFPAAGLSNPTMTIVALALRLADHLRASL